MLLAIVTRSGLARSQDIFITPDAFDRAAATLLEECARSRTAQDSERLRVEVAALREKLGYRVKGKREQSRPDSFAVHAPAMVARLPFIQATESEDMTTVDWLEPVHAVVTEVSDSHLQVRSPLPVQVDERVLVLFALGPAGAGEVTNGAGHRGRIIRHVGRVTRRQTVDEETVIAVDVTNMTDRELDELMRLAQAAAADAPLMQGV
jgi:hypothetical protein